MDPHHLMDPPLTSQLKQRAASAQNAQSGRLQKRSSELSPSPFASNTNSTQEHVEKRRPQSSHIVSVGWEDGGDLVSPQTSRLQVEIAGCVETKTVITTTTTKRSYPPLSIQPSKTLSHLNAKEYPLAFKPTPSELANFSYTVEDPTSLGDHDKHLTAAKTSRTQLRRFSPGQAGAGEIDYPEVVPKQAEAPRSDRSRREQAEVHLRRSLQGLSDVAANMPVHSSSKSRQPRNTDLKGYALNAGEPKGRLLHRLGLGNLEDALPITPDLSGMESATPDFARFTPQSDPSRKEPYNEVTSPDSSDESPYNGAVATPPTAESDLDPAEVSGPSFVEAQGLALNTVAAQNASLPSPGLSPIAPDAGFHNALFEERLDEDRLMEVETDPEYSGQDITDRLPLPKVRGSRCLHRAPPVRANSAVPTVMDIGPIIQSFDLMPDEMKALVMYQLSRRCPKKVLRQVANFINPALMCDYLVELPTELSLHIVGYLDRKDLCRAAQVSKKWRSIIDSNETGWKELLDRDGFVLPVGELERAIYQGWGWQDPYGPDAFEKDMTVVPVLPPASSGSSVAHSSKSDSTRKVRSTTKRKRAFGGPPMTERSKRRATGNDFHSKAQEILSRYPYTARYHKSEGPLSAASAAAAAVPDPQLGLPGLRKLHLFKSLYRRHYLLADNWLHPVVKPHHMAFKAHPTHVVTCLQFDDDKILTGSDDSEINVYDTKTGALRKRLQGHEGGVWALQYEGNTLVSGSTDRSVRVWDIEKGICTQVFHGHTSTVRCLQILMPSDSGLRSEEGLPIMMPEKPLIITGSRDSQLRVWKLPDTGSRRYIQAGPPANDADCPYFVRVMHGHTHSVRAIAAHCDTLVSGSYDHSVRVWKISTGETVRRLTGHSGKVYSVVLDEKRNRCISGSMDNLIKIWSLETGVCLFTLEGHSSLVGLLDLRDERLVSAAADSTLRIWDPESGTCKSTLSAHTGAITCFQHDGQKVISGSDRTLKMWNIKTGECITDLLTDLTGVWQVKFNDRRCVAAVQRDSVTYVEVLDFGASRDGVPASERGRRIVLPGRDDHRVVDVDDDEDAAAI